MTAHDATTEAETTGDFEMPAPPEPADDLSGLDHLIGEWEMTGGAEGTIRYQWMEGGYFLVQHVDLVQFGQPITGIEIIGHVRPFAGDPDPDIRSRFFDNTGNVFDYVYDPQDDGSIVIWGGERGSEAFCRTTIDGDTLRSEWTYPGGGGYATEGRRLD